MLTSTRTMTRALAGLSLLVILTFCFGEAQAGERRRKPYGSYDHDTMGLLDDINRDYGIPQTPGPVVGRGPTGYYESDPYNPRKWRYDTRGMIDQINADHGVPVASPQYSEWGYGPTGRMERNAYDIRKWRYDTPGMIDAINRQYPPIYVTP